MSAFYDARLSLNLALAAHEGRLMVIAECATALLLQAKPDCLVAQGLRERCLQAQSEAAAARAEYDREFEQLCRLPVCAKPLNPVSADEE